ncbi:hypothetical protein ANO11243_071020 [Dothideomycetidae sp. 11243]|nr:hypothetical protein ANO11243_071020 [fungal sp. No.11243]
MYLSARSLTNTDINDVPITGTAALILGISLAMATIAVVAIGLRLYAARTGSAMLRWDFYFVVVGTLLGVATEALFAMAVKNGIGKHIQEVSFDELWQALKWSWIGIFTGLTGTFVAKLGIVAMLYQVATPTQKRRKAVLITIGGINVLAGIVQLALSLTQCSPYQKLWYMLTPGTCDRTSVASTFGYVQGTIAVLADFALAVYPVTIVWNLQASLRTKVGFCALMAGGIICAAAAIMRTYYITKLRHPTDPTWDLVPFLAWASTELWFVIIIGSIPPLRPLFIRWFGNTKSLLSGSATRSRTGKNSTIPLRSVNGTNAGTMMTTKNEITSRIMTNPDGSEENILPRKGNGEQIMVSKAYTIETMER